MDEYINRDVLLKAVEKMDRLDKETKTKYEYNKEGYILLLKSAPAADVAPVVHAHWKEYYPPKEFILTGEEKLYICSNCDAKYSHIENQRFCPWCGAQMDKSISCGHENDNNTQKVSVDGVKIPVISMEDVPKIMEEMEK